MSITIFDLAHNREGFEDAMIQKICAALKDSHQLTTDLQSVRLAVAGGPVARAAPDARVVLIVCHGERTASPVLTAGGGRVSFHVGDFYLETEIEGADLSGAPADEAEGLAIALRDPGMLSSYLALPSEPFAVVWYVCNSATADAPLFHVKNCRASLSFHGAAWEYQYEFVAEAAALLHALVQVVDPTPEAVEQLRSDFGAKNACFVFRGEGKTLILPVIDEI